MKTTTSEETKANAGLVRDVEAVAKMKLPSEEEVRFRDAIFRKAMAFIDKMEIHHVRRINEALCSMEFLNDTAKELRKRTQYAFAKLHDLKSYRKVAAPAAPAAVSPHR